MSNSSSSSTKYSVLFGCSLMLTIAYMSLSSWGAAIPELSQSFNLTGTMIQIGSAALIAGYAIGSFIEGKALSSFGWKPTFLFSMILFLAGSVLIPFMSNYYVIILLRFLMGFGLIVNITCALVGGWFPTHQRGLAIGILVGCIGLGSALGGYLTSILTPMVGWKNTFLVLAAITVAGILVFCMTVKTPPVQLEEEVPGVEIKEPDFKGNIYAQPALWLFALALLCVFFNVYGMYAFIGQYVQGLGYSAKDAGLIIFFNGFIAVISTPVGGWVSDTLIKSSGDVLGSRAKAVAFVGALVGFIGCLLVPFLAPSSVMLAILVATVAGWGCPATNSPILSLPSDIFGSKAAGPANGIVILIAGIGGIIAPILVSYQAENYGAEVAWITLAISAAICFLISIALPKFKIKQ